MRFNLGRGSFGFGDRLRAAPDPLSGRAHFQWAFKFNFDVDDFFLRAHVVRSDRQPWPISVLEVLRCQDNPQAGIQFRELMTCDGRA